MTTSVVMVESADRHQRGQWEIFNSLHLNRVLGYSIPSTGKGIGEEKDIWEARKAKPAGRSSIIRPQLHRPQVLTVVTAVTLG